MITEWSLNFNSKKNPLTSYLTEIHTSSLAFLMISFCWSTHSFLFVDSLRKIAWLVPGKDLGDAGLSFFFAMLIYNLCRHPSGQTTGYWESAGQCFCIIFTHIYHQYTILFFLSIIQKQPFLGVNYTSVFLEVNDFDSYWFMVSK